MPTRGEMKVANPAPRHRIGQHAGGCTDPKKDEKATVLRHSSGG